MTTRILLLTALILTTLSGTAQNLFSYGNESVTTADFVRAYNKNNTPPATGKAKAMRNYLDLYVNSRLKIREAYERRYDTLPQIKTEVANLRNQIMENYFSDPETMKFLVGEAFTRSQKDIHVGHLFISFSDGDTLTAYNRAGKVYEQLKEGADFMELAKQLSLDPGSTANKGDIGWITVLTLPYTFENAIYSLSKGGYSEPVRSKSGYHLFKHLGERKAVGKMKARHILLAFPPNADESVKNKIGARADSIYKRIQAGGDFEKFAQEFSNDYLTAVTGGSMPDFGVGQYDPVFEANVWGLIKDGATTKPFRTSYGYHIVRRISQVPVPGDSTDKNFEQELRQRIIQDQRLKVSNEVIFKKVVQQAGFKKAGHAESVIWALSDSLLDGHPPREGKALTRQSELFTLGDTTLKIDNWISYAQAFRYKRDGSGRKAYPELMDEFVHYIATEYYRDHLESFNDDFRFQMNEFKDGNLFFEIMQNEIWNKAHSDSSELLALYNTNKKKYTWTKSADAVIFFCSDQVVAKTLFEQLKKDPKNWKMYADALTEKVVADSSRYEWDQLPSKTKIVPYNGLVTSPLINTTDNSASFAYVIKTYPKPMQRSFNEAKGLVINDYQALLEEQWLKQLREKYPVTIDEQAWNKLTTGL